MKPRVLPARPESARAQELAEHGCTRESSCTGKVRHPTRNDARAGAKAVALKLGRSVATYKCPLCHGWHITKARHGEIDE